MALREDYIGQTWLVPRRVTDFIPENHICYFIANLAEELDFKKIEQKYRHTKGKASLFTSNVTSESYHSIS